MQFQGFDIDGSLVDYMHKLDSKGFKNVGIEKGVGILNANLEGYRNCIVNAVSGNSNTNVYLVSVCYTYASSPADLEPGYQNIKKKLIENYGEVAEENTGTFQEFVYPGYEKAWHDTTVPSDCKFITPNGIIKLAIIKRNMCTLSIVYIDKVNQKKAMNN